MERHTTWQKIFFKRISKLILNFISNEFVNPENEPSKDTTCHTSRGPRRVNSSTVAILFFEAKLLYESLQPLTCDSPDFVNLRPPLTPKSGLSSQNPEIC